MTPDQQRRLVQISLSLALGPHLLDNLFLLLILGERGSWASSSQSQGASISTTSVTPWNSGESLYIYIKW